MTRRAIFLPDDYRMPALICERSRDSVPFAKTQWHFPTEDPALVARVLGGTGVLLPLHRSDDDTNPGRKR